jgi:uncharacterized cupin superfamily protein
VSGDRPPASVHEPHFDQDVDRAPFGWRRALLGRQAGCEQLGASLFDVPPGAATFPFHAHHANEELLVVLAGRPTLRTLEGERELAPGEVVAFLAGRRGAHRIDNRTDETVRIVIVSTMHAPEINEFPDSGTLWARTFAPGAAAGEDDRVAVGRVGDGLDPLAGGV